MQSLNDPPPPLHLAAALPETVGYRLKRRLLGPPLITRQLSEERLSNPLALGVLSSDCISSSAYGSEEMLLVLLPAFGVAAFTLLLPLTGVILAVLILVTLCYRHVVMIYTRAGGSYVVARQNFGQAVAQLAAVALMLDYVVTVAVQSAAGTAALVSAVPTLRSWTPEITVTVVVLLFYGNLRGLREAGRTFAFPTYFFVLSMAVVIVLGIVREVLGDLPHYDIHEPGAVPVGNGHALTSAIAVFVLLRAFANGGSSLTGLEAISNGVGAFRRPEGRNARKTLVVMSCLLGTLVLGVSWLAHETHAIPYTAGTPTVISQVAKAVLGGSVLGHALFLTVQLATMLILYTGANTPFTGFAFAGFGMARYFSRERGDRWRRKVAVNLAAGATSLAVVGIFAVVKFTEGAWLVVVIFPLGVVALIRLNRQYRAEARCLDLAPTVSPQSNIARHVVLVLVDNLDLATLRALRYGRSLKPSELRAVHFVIDAEHAAALQAAWADHPAVTVPLQVIDCPDRRLARAALELVVRYTANPRTEATLLLPRRIYSRLLGRLLHDRTAEEIAEVVSGLPRASATIVPFNVTKAINALPEDALHDEATPPPRPDAAVPTRTAPAAKRQVATADPDGLVPISDLDYRSRALVEGVIRVVGCTPVSDSPTLEFEVWG